MKLKLDYLKKKLIYFINLAKLIFKKENHMSVLVWKVQISLQILQVLNEQICANKILQLR